MDNDALRPLVADGLRAAKGGARQAAEAADQIHEAASNDRLRHALEEGQTTTAQWRSRIDNVMETLSVDGEDENPVVEAVYEVAQSARAAAEGDRARDLGIIASGQIALHYWIAAFGTLGAYLKDMGQTDAAQTMSQCVDEARAADEQHTEIAQDILSA